MELYDRDKILLHICCRIIACLGYPVTILYLMFTGRMIYDKLMSKFDVVLEMLTGAAELADLFDQAR